MQEGGDNLMSDTTDLDLFIGSKSSYEKHLRTNNIESEDAEDIKSSNSKESEKRKNVAVLSKETLKPISDDMLNILKRTRTIHDYNTVYMQSSLEFYDEYYNDNEASEELKAARQIRRVYRVYLDYIKAIDIRNAYIDTLIEKYGGEDTFQSKLSMGLVKDWIPKMPILSKKCPDYEMYLSGLIPIESETLPEGTTQEVIDSMQKELDGVELEESFDIETCIGMVDDYNEYVESIYNEYGLGRNSKSNTVTISDLEELNKVFKSWYKPDTGETEQIMFKNAPENIKKRFLEYCSFNEPGLLNKVGHGEEIEPELPDMNEMVYDEKTGKNMTRKELMQRQTIRLMAQNGWSESRLLNYSNVGSRLEKMKRKKKVSRKRKRPSNELFDDIMNSPTGADPIYSDNEYMSDAFLRLMRGED